MWQRADGNEQASSGKQTRNNARARNSYFCRLPRAFFFTSALSFIVLFFVGRVRISPVFGACLFRFNFFRVSEDAYEREGFCGSGLLRLAGRRCSHVRRSHDVSSTGEARAGGNQQRELASERRRGVASLSAPGGRKFVTGRPSVKARLTMARCWRRCSSSSSSSGRGRKRPPAYVTYAPRKRLSREGLTAAESYAL